jgi:hypothetical protein
MPTTTRKLLLQRLTAHTDAGQIDYARLFRAIAELPTDDRVFTRSDPLFVCPREVDFNAMRIEDLSSLLILDRNRN